MSLLPGVREMTPFGRQKLASHIPEECCFLSNHEESICSPD